MKLSIIEIIRLSRPRFWMYVLGPFLVGIIASGNIFSYNSTTNLLLIAFGLFFLIPANVLIYGVNDIYDYETDVINQKKINYETVLHPEKHNKLWLAICLLTIPFFILLFFINYAALITFIVFLFTGLFYSAKPIRAKGKPPLDILFSSVIYVSPALVGFFITGRTAVDWLPVLGGLVWAFGMQTYSAVPDIDADKKAKVKTLATFLGGKSSLIFTLICYLIATIIGFFYLGPIVIVLGCIYSAIVLLSLLNKTKIFKYYTYFPLVNVVTGGILFFYLFFNTL